jgi:GNAT superfamily N-acetyltransferase
VTIPVAVRPATLEDWSWIQTQSLYTQALSEQATRALIACIGGERIGYVAFGCWGERYVDAIFVAAEHRRHGVATALIRAVEEASELPISAYELTADGKALWQALFERRQLT